MSEHKKTHQGLRKNFTSPILSMETVKCGFCLQIMEHSKLQEHLSFSHGLKNSQLFFKVDAKMDNKMKSKSSKSKRNNTIPFLSEQAKSIFQTSISIQCQFCKILFKKQIDLDNHLSNSDCHGSVVIKEETKESQNYLSNENDNSNGIFSESGT